MIKIGVIHCWLRYNTKSPISLETCNKHYKRFSEHARKMGMQVFLCSPENYQRDGFLKKAIYFDSVWNIKRNIKVDVIFKKAKINDIGNIPIVNDPEFSKIAENKNETYRIFPEIVPRSFVVNNRKDVERFLPKIRTRKIVFKPIGGSGGYGIKIMERPPKVIKMNTIMQEFIKSKNMPKWGTKNRAWDLRVIVADGKIIDTYLRIAKRGSLLSNVHQGGKVRFIKKSEITRDVRRKINLIDKKFRIFKHRIYSDDFIIDPNNMAWLMEINSSPGLDAYYSNKRREKNFHKNILKILKSAYEESRKH